MLVVAVRAVSGPGQARVSGGWPEPGHSRTRMAGTRTRATRDRVVASGTRIAVPSAMVKVEIQLCDVEVWRAVQLAALAAVTRHARRARPEVARRFAAAAAALQRADVRDVRSGTDPGRVSRQARPRRRADWTPGPRGPVR